MTTNHGSQRLVPGTGDRERTHHEANDDPRLLPGAILENARGVHIPELTQEESAEVGQSRCFRANITALDSEGGQLLKEAQQMQNQDPTCSHFGGCLASLIYMTLKDIREKSCGVMPGVKSGVVVDHFVSA